MDNKYINFYNNLVKLTRNKNLYVKITDSDTFSDRLIVLFFHFAFFLKTFRKKSDAVIIQGIFDFIFKQIELSIREIGYGDMSINKKMKSYINTFYSILNEIEKWENSNKYERTQIFHKFLSSKDDKFIIYEDLTLYFEKYRKYLLNNTLNLLLKSVIKEKF